MAKIKDQIIKFLQKTQNKPECYSENENVIEITSESLRAQQKYRAPRYPEYPGLKEEEKREEKREEKE